MSRQAPSIRLDVVRDADLSPAGTVGADLVEACAPFVAAHPEIAALAARCPPGIAVTVRCASAAIFDEWPTVTPDAVGFFATLNTIETEFDLDGEDGLVGIRTEYDLPERIEVVVVADRPGEFVDLSRDDAVIEVEAWLETLPHEVCHAMAWAVVTGGATPLEIYDGGFGGMEDESAVAEALRAADRLMSEDDVEEMGRRITRSVPLALFDGALSRLEDLAAEAPAPR